MGLADKTGGRVAIGLAAGTVLGLVVGPLLLWLPVGAVAGALWEKKR